MSVKPIAVFLAGVLMEASISLSVGLPFVVAEDIPVQVGVYINKRLVGDCVYFLSEQKENEPPGVPRIFDGDILISQDTKSASLQIMCKEKQGMEKVLQILQVLTGVKEE